MEKKYFESFDGTSIPYLYFESTRKNKFKNNIVIFHGVTEHMMRYEEFGRFLAANGYNVFVLEIRGHGELKNKEICDFGKKGIKGVFEDVNIFFKNVFPENELNAENTILAGHSMGSLIALKWGIENNYKYFILSGFPLKRWNEVVLGRITVMLEKIFRLEKSFLNIEFKRYNEFFKSEGMEFGWLTRDKNEVLKYENDELCGYSISPGAFSGILEMMSFINRKYRKLRADAKLLVLYGTEDKAVDISYINKMLNILKKGKRKINIIENEKGRHESLNEINKYKIYDEILKWINEK